MCDPPPVLSQPRSTAPAASLTPLIPEERIVVLDVLRGFALFGILVMNMSAFNRPWSSWAMQPRMFQGTVDLAFEFMKSTLFAGKANAIFSLLFGLGMAIQLNRAADRGGTMIPMYLRRLAVLFAIGAAHAVLLWHGDVLHIYAALGLLLLAVRRVPDRGIVGLIALFLVLPMLRSAWALYSQEPPIHPVAHYAAQAHEHLRVFQSGTYLEQIGARLHDYYEGYIEATPHLQGEMWFYMSIAVTMLIGFVAGRRRLHEDVQTHNAALRKVTAWCLGIGLGIALGFSIARTFQPPPTGQPTLAGFLMGVTFNLHRPLLCVGYVAALALLLQRERVRRLLLPLASAGAMPLSNYLLQSLICTTLFYSHGLALYGQVGPALSFALAVVIFAVQVVISRMWLASFRYGPLEWLWRGAAYGELPPIRRTSGRQ
jgi:uncharacterized protein